LASGNLTVDGAGASVQLPFAKATVILSGDFGSGTAIIQMLLADGATWLAITGASWTAAVTQEIVVEGQVRVSLSGATSPDLDWEIRPYLRNG
jgi:hypothetical protein